MSDLIFGKGAQTEDLNLQCPVVLACRKDVRGSLSCNLLTNLSAVNSAHFSTSTCNLEDWFLVAQ